MKNKFLLFCLSSLCLFSCGETTAPEDFSVAIGVSNAAPSTADVLDFFLKNTDAKTVKTAAWNFGDGETSSGLTVQHKYASAGVYTVSVTAKNTAGATALATATITVTREQGRSLRHSLQTFDRSKIWLCAHRCNADDGQAIPENSIPALRHCIELAAQGVLEYVEIDPRMTKDGVIVIMHDETVNRTTNGTGKLAELNYAQIRNYRLKLPDGTVTGDTIPTLRQFLLEAKGKMFVNLDFQDKVDVETLYKLVKELGMLDEVLFYTAGATASINYLAAAQPQGIAYTNVTSESQVNSHYDKGVLITHIPSNNVLTMPLVINAARTKGMLIGSETLVQNGVTIDGDIKNNGDYSGIDSFVGAGLNILQTDQSPLINAYLRSKGKR